jgi:CRISPR-associated endoribonuclease Cas6
MRIKLTLKQRTPEQAIPINYQYPLSSAIYNIIGASNVNHSTWLHHSGFKSGNKSFKFFTFSELIIPGRLINGKTIKILSEEINLIISAINDITTQHFIAGLFKQKELNLFSHESEANFDVKSIEYIPEPEYRQEMTFATLSPMVLSKKTEHTGKVSVKYLAPTEPDYFEYLKRNIEDKYITYCINTKTPPGESSIDSFELLSEPKPKLITINEGKPNETKVKGYHFTFKLKGRPEMMKICYETGFGKSCSLGFGCVKSINGNFNK